MNNNLKISSTRVRRLFHYLEDFEKGQIQIPPFQRDFVWETSQKIELLDSIKKGYPIGSILFWKPYKELDKEEQIVGAYYLPEKHSDAFYILDGYQRLSTLFGCLINPEHTNLKRDEIAWKKGFDIIYNLEKDKFEFNRKKNELEIYKVPVYKFIDGREFYEFQTELIKQNIPKEKATEYLERYKSFGTKISTYDIPSTDLVGGTIKEAVDIFSRLNSRGLQISNDWKISALSYSKENNFRLGTEIDNLFLRLKKYNYFTSKSKSKNKSNRRLILQCITNSFGEIYFDTLASNDQNKLEELASSSNFITTTKRTFIAIEKAVEFLFKELRVLNDQLIPYNNQFIFITDFFNQIEKPNNNQLEILKKWFWVTTYSNYFTTNLSKQRLAYLEFQDFIQDETKDPIYYEDNTPFSTKDFPQKINMGSVRAKALALFMLNHQADVLNLNIKEGTTYKSLKLLKKEPNDVENTIFYVNNSENNKNTDWLNKSVNHDAFFIDFKIKELNSENSILEYRKYYIIKLEKEFVEKLKINYKVGDEQPLYLF